MNCLIERGALDPRDALPLIGFRAQWNYPRLLDFVLGVCSATGEKERVTAHLYRYLQFEGGGFGKLKKVASQHGMTISGLDEAVAFEEKRTASAKKSEYDPLNGTSEAPSKPARNWDDVFARCDLTTAEGLSRAYAAFKNTEPPWYHDQFFKEAI